MRKKLYLYLFLATMSLSALPGLLIAQDALDVSIDSLQRAAAEAPHDTTSIRLRLELLRKISRRYMLQGNKVDDSLLFFRTLETCQQQSKKRNHSYGLGSTFLSEAYFWNMKGMQARRDELVEKAFAVFRAANEKAGLAAAYYQKAAYDPGTDLDKKLRIYDTAVFYAKASGDQLKEEAAIRDIANTQAMAGNYNKAIQILQELLELQKKRGSRIIFLTTDLLSEMYRQTGNPKEALRCAISTIDYCRKVNDTSHMVTFYIRLAGVYRAIYDYEKAFHYYQLADASFRTMDHVRVMVITSMVTCLIRQNKLREAHTILINRLPNPEAVEERAKPFVYNMYLDFYRSRGDYHKARTHLEILLGNSLVWTYTFNLTDLLTTAGTIYFKLGEFDKAAHFSDSAYKMALNERSWSYIGDNSLTFFRLDSVKGNYASAIRHYQEYKQASDSLQKEMADKQMIEMSVQYETDQKNAELASLSNKAKLQQETIRQGKIMRNLMIAASCLLLLLLFLAYNRYRVKQKANELLQQKQDEINRQNIVLGKMVEDEKKTTAEKEWLIKEINHRVKNNLQVVMSLLDSQRSYLKDEVALNAINDSQHRVEAIALIHKKLYQSDRLNTLIDMASYIRELTEYLSDSFGLDNRIQVNLSIEAIVLDVTQSVPLGLIINEAFTNAVKYAFIGRSDGKISIRMERTATGSIGLQISDNGTGLPEHFDWKKSQSLGMSLIRGLAKQIDGHFEVLNGNGVTMKITFDEAQSMRA